MSEFALDKLQKLAEVVPEAQRTPELRLLLKFAECSRQAEVKLGEVGQLRQAGAAAEELLAQPETFQGLACFVRAVALGAEAAGVGLCSSEVLTLLREALLQPIVCKEEDGSYQAHRPSVVCPTPSPLNMLQLLASGVFLHVTSNPEPAIAMLSAALIGVWPPPRTMQRRLVAHQFMPAVGSSTSRDGVEAAAAGDVPAAGKPGAQAEGSSSGGGHAAAAQAGISQEASASGSQSVATAVAADSHTAQEAAEEGTRPNDVAVALQAALAEHCPDISLSDVHKSALVLRLFLGCRAVGEQRDEGASLQAVVRMLLMDCQQLLDLDPSCLHTYVWAAQLLLYARWPLDQSRARALFEEGVRRTRDAQCWLAAGEVGHDYALWLVTSTAGERNVAVRQAALLEAGKLLEGVKEAEAALKPWMPPGRLHQLTARREQLAGLLQQLQSGQRGNVGTNRASRASSCAFCGHAAAQLRLCGSCKLVGYCSRECQVKDWKAGHNAVCSGGSTPAPTEITAATSAAARLHLG